MPELPPEPVLRYYRALGPEAFLDLLGYEFSTSNHKHYVIWTPTESPANKDLLRRMDFFVIEAGDGLPEYKYYWADDLLKHYP